MARGYANDLRVRVIEFVETGEAAREAARQFNIGDSTAIRWVQRWKKTGSVAAKPGTGHSRSPLKKHEQWLLGLVVEKPDLTLEEIQAMLAEKHRLEVGIGSVWRFYERHGISFKKNGARRRAGST
jgi:transposase